MHTITAFGDSASGAYMDIGEHPVAILVTPEGDVFVGPPFFPIACTVSAERTPFFSVIAEDGGYLMSLHYDNNTSPLALGKYTGADAQRWILAWISLARADSIKSNVPALMTPRVQ